MATGGNNARGISYEEQGLLPGPQGWLVDPVHSLDCTGIQGWALSLGPCDKGGSWRVLALSSSLPLPQGTPWARTRLLVALGNGSSSLPPLQVVPHCFLTRAGVTAWQGGFFRKMLSQLSWCVHTCVSACHTPGPGASACEEDRGPSEPWVAGHSVCVLPPVHWPPRSWQHGVPVVPPAPPDCLPSLHSWWRPGSL